MVKSTIAVIATVIAAAAIITRTISPPPEDQQMTETTQRMIHWQRTKRLMILTLSLWFIFSFVVHWFAGALNAFTFLGFPLGFYMAAQGSEIIFVVLIFAFTKLQHNIDRETGFAETE